MKKTEHSTTHDDGEAHGEKKICIRFSLGRQSMCTVNGGVTCKRFRWAGLTMWSMSCNRIHEKRLDALLGFGAAH